MRMLAEETLRMVFYLTCLSFDIRISRLSEAGAVFCVLWNICCDLKRVLA